MLAEGEDALATRKLDTCSPMFIDVNGTKFGTEAGSNLSRVVDLMYMAER